MVKEKSATALSRDEEVREDLEEDLELVQESEEDVLRVFWDCPEFTGLLTFCRRAPMDDGSMVVSWYRPVSSGGAA